MGESRQELLQWLNSLLQLNVTKVEQCGTGYVKQRDKQDTGHPAIEHEASGENVENYTDIQSYSAALCQIFDSIFLDIPMAKVKFNVTSEYAYIQNFKVLQNCFTKHSIDRSIPIESLVKCKMQDNLEFLQWSKRYWDQYFPGIEYDPVARRKASGPVSNAVTGSASRATPTTSAARRPVANSNTGATRAPRTGSAMGVGGGANSALVQNLTQQNAEMKESVVGLERERDFYFNKLREIEVLLQAEVDAHPEIEQEEGGVIGRVQQILYSTEEGFEIPDAEEEGAGEMIGGEEETF